MHGDVRGQTESIGSILLVAVIVLTVTTYGVFYLGTISDSEQGPVAEFEASVNTSSVNVTHAAGEGIEREELLVVTRDSSGVREEFHLEFGTLDPETTDGDSQFESGEEWWNTTPTFQSCERIRVLVVHEASDRVLYDGTQVTSGC